MNDCKCQRIEINFEDTTEEVALDFNDKSENIKIEMLESGNTIFHNQAVVLTGTCDYWNSKPELITQKDVFYVYTDYCTVNASGEEVRKPGVKIGDGKAYLIDTPFIAGGPVDITAADIERWNLKWRGYVLETSPENLVFTTL